MITNQGCECREGAGSYGAEGTDTSFRSGGQAGSPREAAPGLCALELNRKDCLSLGRNFASREPNKVRGVVEGKESVFIFQALRKVGEGG